MSSVGGTVMSLFGCSENLGDFAQICYDKTWKNLEVIYVMKLLKFYRNPKFEVIWGLVWPSVLVAIYPL